MTTAIIAAIRVRAVLTALTIIPAEERAAHKRWAHLALGGEWFRTTDELLAWAEGLGAP